MLDDARDESVPLTRSAQVAVIGSGPAGATLALALSRYADVLVIESGGLEDDPETARLYEGESIGIDYSLVDTRARRLGGSSHLWSGWCTPFDPLDFAERPWVEHSGWPFGTETLAPYYADAAHLLNLNNAVFDAAGTLSRIGVAAPRLDPLETVLSLWRFGLPTARFGESSTIRAMTAAQVHVLCHASVVDIRLDSSHSQVRELVVRSTDGREGRISADFVVIACGGIETPRILLNCRSQVSYGIGNAHDNVGRFFMEHPHAELASVPPIDDDWYECATRKGIDVAQHPFILAFGVPPARQIEERILNARAHFYLPPTGSGPMARLGVFMEQAPDPDSRITLGRARDRLGMLRARLNWKLGKLDEYSAQRTGALLATQLKRMGVQHERIEPPYFANRKAVTYTSHHIGTTRMTNDRERGVVDSSCRVHDIDNLFVAGSSVFPTASWANPTFTIVALALRLAAHLRELIAPEAKRDMLQ